MTIVVNLTTGERALMVRLAGGAVIWSPASRGARVGSTHEGWVHLPSRQFDRLKHFTLVEVSETRSSGVFYRISGDGKTWCTANDIPLLAPSDSDAPRVTVALQPLCRTPVPFESAPDVCGNCGNMLDKHFGKPDPVASDRIKDAMWQVMIQLGGPYDMYGGGVDTMVAPMFREHMNVCGVDLQQSESPTMDDQALFTDSEDSDSTTEILSARMTCQCGRYRNETIAINDLTLGQLIWHAAHLHDNQGG